MAACMKTYYRVGFFVDFACVGGQKGVSLAFDLIDFIGYIGYYIVKCIAAYFNRLVYKKSIACFLF